MANNTNPVFGVLIPYGNQSVLPAGQHVSRLSPGQIGVFDADTHLSIDGSSFVDKFYIAVGYDEDGDGLMDNVLRSAGDYIKTKNIHNYSRRDYVAGQPMIVEVSNIQAECNKTYTLKVILWNDAIAKNQGYNLYTKTYTVTTSCCGTCADCTSGDCNELVKLFLNAINNDPNALVEAFAVDPSNNVISDIDAFIASNHAVNTDSDPNNDVCAKLRIMTKPVENRTTCGIPIRYYHPLETTIEVVLMDAMSCVADTTVVQPLVYEQGSGHFVRNREYIAGGWSGNPGTIRTTTYYGTIGRDFNFKSILTEKYDTIDIEYSNAYAGGWLDYDHNISTEIYIPRNDDNTMNTLIAVLNNLLTPLGFKAQ